jgi:hypothetical protein
MDSLKVEPGSDSEICHDGNQVIDIKIEEVTGIQEEEDPVLRTFPGIKVEREVSRMSVCTLLGSFLRYLQLPFVFLISICLSIHITHHLSSEWILKNPHIREEETSWMCESKVLSRIFRPEWNEVAGT